MKKCPQCGRGYNDDSLSYCLDDGSEWVALGDRDKALAALERAVAEHDVPLTRLKVDPLFDPLREEPRFKDILKRMNLS